MTNHEQNDFGWQRLKNRLADLDPTTVPGELLHLARAVAGVHDQTITCEECRAWLPSYVDDEVGGLPMGQSYPQVKRHLDLCADCEAEYLEMLELALVEDAGELPVPKIIPTPVLSFLPPLSFVELIRGIVIKVAKRVLEILDPDRLEELAIIGDTFFVRVEELGGQFSLRQAPAMALGLGAEEASMALLSLAASYETTRRIATTFSAQEIQAHADQEDLADILAQVAEKVARETMMSRKQARVFAQIYAEGARDEIDTWLSLAETLH
jgi:hypothetical protein